MTADATDEVREPAPEEEEIRDPSLPRESNIPWMHRDRINPVLAFWKTVFHVIARNGRIGSELDADVTVRSGKRFRFLCVFHALFGIVSFYVLTYLAIRPGSGRIGEEVAFAAFLFALFGTALAWLLLALANSAVNWFFYPGHLPAPKAENALALSYYRTAPLALLLLLLPVAFSLFAPDPMIPRAVWGIGRWWLIGVVLWWVQMVFFGLRSITRRSGWRVALSGIALLLVWGVMFATILFLPVTLTMWFLLAGSLT